MLAEWHLSPDEILERWTDERLDLFWRKRNQRLRRLRAMMDGDGEDEEQEKPRYVSNREFFTAPIPGSNGGTIANPNATRLKRIQVMQ